MANIGPYPDVPYHWQGVSLHCWLTCIEMLMGWKYGNKYGQQQGRGRDAHAAETLHRSRHGWGIKLKEHAVDYGLERLEIYPTLTNLQTALRARGPTIAAGGFGAARLGIGGHAILIVGWSNSGQICYYDPFFVGRKAMTGNHYMYMTPENTRKRVGLSSDGDEFWAARWDLQGDNPVRQPVMVGDARTRTQFLLL